MAYGLCQAHTHPLLALAQPLTSNASRPSRTRGILLAPPARTTNVGCANGTRDGCAWVDGSHDCHEHNAGETHYLTFQPVWACRRPPVLQRFFHLVLMKTQPAGQGSPIARGCPVPSLDALWTDLVGLDGCDMCEERPAGGSNGQRAGGASEQRKE